MEIAVAAALGGAFGGTGQKCTASSRLIVHSAVHDEFVERLAAGAAAMVVDNALKDGTQIGPVVSQTQLDENMAYMELAKSEGGEIICGGDRVSRDTDGYYMTPAVVVGTSNDWRINIEEMFAPIACVIKADSYDEALHLVNDTHFGLTSGIVTRDLARASHFRRNARTGCVMVNLPTAGTDYHVPFGGRGSSSYGPREQGGYAVEFYTTVKTAYISSGTPS
jgi:aldehyde dehydrogenase (NAD+)